MQHHVKEQENVPHFILSKIYEKDSLKLEGLKNIFLIKKIAFFVIWELAILVFRIFLNDEKLAFCLNF